MSWDHCDVITFRWRRKQPFDVALPVRVVEDRDDVTILYTAVGTPMKAEATADGRVMSRDVAPFFERQSLVGGYVDWTWTTNHVLMFAFPDSLASIWLFFREGTWEFNGYYVNMQAPLDRTEVGFDSADYMLDIVVQPDFSWEWKDLDEFADARMHGFLPRELLDRIQVEAEATIPLIESRGFPFAAGYETWRPDPAWGVPELPSNWADGMDLTGFTLF
ncbi:MAG: DUF402 domain-containing protein [Thermomicrobiales bacterium]